MWKKEKNYYFLASDVNKKIFIFYKNKISWKKRPKQKIILFLKHLQRNLHLFIFLTAESHYVIVKHYLTVFDAYLHWFEDKFLSAFVIVIIV